MTSFAADLSVGKGLLWLKAPKPREDGTLVSARRLGPESEAVPARRADMFSHVAYGHSADRFAAVDGRGDIYIFHLRANRFSLVYRAGQEVTALSFCCGRDNDMLVACADKSIRIIKSDTGVLVAKLNSHRATITSLASHPMERYAVSCGADHTMLWDLESLRRTRNIGGGNKRSTYMQAAFLHSGNMLITLSRQDGISLFHFPTLDLRAKLLPNPDAGVSLRCFAVTANRMHLVAATVGRSAYVWHLPSETMIEEISLPAPVSAVGGLQALLPYSCTKLPEGSEMCMLGEDGIVRVLEVPLGRVTACVGAATYNFAVHHDRVVTATTDGALHLMDLAYLRGKASKALSSGAKSDAAQHKPEARPLHSAASKSNSKANGQAQNDLGLQAIRPLARPILGPADHHTAAVQPESTKSARAPKSGRAGGRKPRRSDNNSSAAKGQQQLREEHAEGMAPWEVLWAQRTERLKAYLDVHEAFTDEHRLSAWTHLLNLPHNDVAYGALVSLEEMPLACDQLAQCLLVDSRVKQRLARVVHVLAHWCEALACSPFLPSFVLPFVRFFGRDDHAAAEACIMLILNWVPAWFEYWPAPPLHILAVAERLAFLHDPALVKHLVQIGATTKDYVWPVLCNMFSEVLHYKVWLQLMDHVLTNPPQFVLYILVAFIVHMRGALMSVRDRTQLSYFVSRVQPVDIRSLLSIARKIEQLARVQEVSEQFGLPSAGQRPPPYVFLQPSRASSSYPLLTTFPRTAVDHHLQQYMQIREEEEQYLRRKKMAAELEEQTCRLLQQDKTNKEQADLVEQARLEQRKQMEALAEQRRARMLELDARAKSRQLAHIQHMQSQGQEQANAIAEKQRRAIQELEQQLALRFKEEEEWMSARLEAERLQDIQVATVSKLHHVLQERQDEAQALGIQSEIDARTKMLDMKQRAREQLWMIEDQQKQMESKMALDHAEREANITEEAKARASLEVRMQLEEERQRQNLAVIEAQRQARSLTEGMAQRLVQRHMEQHKVEEVLAAEELRHMDAIARRREAEMQGRMQEGERLIRDERTRIDQLKDERQQRLRLLEARQRMENFERQLAEQQGAWKMAAAEHERQVHKVLLDLEEERKNISQFDDEIATREEELLKKMDSLERQREEHSRFIRVERAKVQLEQQQEHKRALGGGAFRGEDAGVLHSEARALPRPGERGYWQMRAAAAGINFGSKGHERVPEGHPQAQAGSASSSSDKGASSSDWIQRDVAKATATVRSRARWEKGPARDGYNFKVEVLEDSSGTGAASFSD